MVEIYKANFRYSVVRSVFLDLEFLKKLYKELSNKVKEAAEIEVREAIKLPNMDDKQFHEYKESLKNSHDLAITVLGLVDTTVGSDISVLSPENVPDDIHTVIFDSSVKFKFFFNREPKNFLKIHFDFNKPPIFDFSNPSHAPTPNQSFIQVSGNNDTWVNGVFQSIKTELEKKKTKRNWLHSQYIYDFCLWTLIVPISFWNIYRIEIGLKLSKTLPIILTVVVIF